jgi:hypothetical protein
MLLQQIPVGEGLATINQDEAELMKSYGGSGTPLPGTQGLGPGGGPVRSFQEGMFSDDGDYDTSFGNDSSGGSSGGSSNDSGGQTPSYDIGAEFGGSTSSSSTGGDSSGSSSLGDDGFAQDPASYEEEPLPDQGQFETRPEVIQGRDTKEGRSGDWNGHLASGGTTWDGIGDQPITKGEQPGSGSTGGGTGGTTTTTVAPPPKYYDKNGNEHASQTDANTANATIDANISAIEGLTLTTDQNFKSWMLANKDTYPVPPNSEASLEGAFNNAKIRATDAASVELPKMVDSMNVYLRDNELGASASYDDWAKTYPKPANLSETTMRTMYANAVFKAERKEAFTLTTEELESWMRPPVVIATADNFVEWWEGKKGQFKDGTFDDREFALAAHQAAIIGDAKAVTIDTSGMTATAPTLGTIDPADTVTVGTTGDVTDTDVGAIGEVTDDDIDAIFEGGIDDAEALLIKRVEGTAVSPAEVQLKRSVENNLRMLLGATVSGADSDPAKIRQLKNIWVDMTQEVTGKAAEIRSAESMAAEKELVALYQGKSTIKLQVRLANLEVEKETAFKNGDLALAAKLSNQATRLTEVITQANIDRDISVADLKSRTDAMIAQGKMDLATTLANLQVKKDLAIEQGKLDVALSIANLQKNILLAQVNVEVAVKQRAMDDALAIIAYKGEMALMGLEVEIDTVELQASLQEMGFELTRDLAELDSATQIKVAELTAQWRRAQGDDAKQAAIIQAIGTIITGFATKSDIRAKTNISPGSGEVESFLDALNSYKYNYKDPAAADETGMFVGVMAQDLEKTPMGASFVKDTPNGKQVDYGHGLAAILASQVNIHDRLRHLEEG